MTLKIAIQMDPMEDVQVHGDTTFDMALEAHKRGHEIWVYHPHNLRLDKNRVFARVRKVAGLKREQGEHVEWAKTGGDDLELVDLHGVDVVLVRQDPPYNMRYITACHMLEYLLPDVMVLNDPREIRNAPEKLFPLDFPKLIPPTLITSDETALRAFRDKHQDIILKPLYGNGGAGVFSVTKGDQNFSSLLEMFRNFYDEPVIAQKYLPEVRKGDKRIILLDGEPVGAINRVPADHEARSNMHVGGKATPVEMTERDKEICAAIGPALKERRLVLVGIDVIGDYMTEINVTSPTGVQEVRRFGGADISALFWDWVEERRG
ncbi:glutathione synthase [Parvularcula flava]|uniref:Glutathione synthetase n=1 Tax=Aquisalinus luteolus TaxID=1566827 RepID=A0A8J3A2L9_9PROT|nr:glutathione synthase [Aquisalinus luteolus]NHK28188.1 glutathione synthase [Aquisalinus luteolus]GGH97729.1 glutathione synthetase [Aquisalinus luteolus]